MENNVFNTNNINIKILNLWYSFMCAKSKTYEPCNNNKCKNKNKELRLKKPILYPSIKRNQLLCIGLNPSHSVKFYIDKKIPISIFDPERCYFNPNENINQKIQEIYKEGTNQYIHYYQKIIDISKYVGLEREHIDMFMFRESCSTCLNKFNKKHRDFADRQKQLTKEIIIQLMPFIIFVGNAEASRIFENELFHNHCFYLENHGYHMTNIGGNLIPTFFSGQLSGGATDNYSFQRLKYLIKKAKGEKEDFDKFC